jgi:Rrf2 family protein
VRISKKAEYALRALVALGRHGRPMLIGDLSRVENIPVKFLEQILLALRNDGFLTSKRGVGGGYGLQVPATKIIVGEVVRALDGPVTPLPCAGITGNEVPCSCPDPRTCPLRKMMTQLHGEMNEFLDSRTIDDLVRADAGHVMAFEI